MSLPTLLLDHIAQRGESRAVVASPWQGNLLPGPETVTKASDSGARRRCTGVGAVEGEPTLVLEVPARRRSLSSHQAKTRQRWLFMLGPHEFLSCLTRSRTRCLPSRLSADLS